MTCLVLIHKSIAIDEGYRYYLMVPSNGESRKAIKSRQLSVKKQLLCQREVQQLRFTTIPGKHYTEHI